MQHRHADDHPVTEPTPANAAVDRYLRPGAFTRNVFNPLVARLARWGVSFKGSRVLEVRGRTTGELRATPVNLLTIDGIRDLVAPRGETHWVRNLRVAGGGTLRLGRRVESFTATELADQEKSEVLRAYLRAWAWEVGRFFDGLTAESSDDEVGEAAADFPVFRVAD